MKPLYEKWVALIDITYKCGRGCLYCSRYSKHLRPDQMYDMSLDKIKEALLSYKDIPTAVGIIGGEPLLFTEFPELCRLIQSIFPKEKMVLFTSGGPKHQEYSSLMLATFGTICHNEHTDYQVQKQLHQPLTIAIDEAVQDENIKNQLIDGCWVQRTWCCTINNFGAYFCEVAAALDFLLYDGAYAQKVEPDWWKQPSFDDQKNALCGKCGMPIPIEREHVYNTKENISPLLLQEMRDKNLARVSEEHVKVFDKVLTKEEIESQIPKWCPGNYRLDIVDDEHCGEGKGFIGELK